MQPAKLYFRLISCLSLVYLSIVCTPSIAAASKFDMAAKSYLDGKYEQAVSEFESLAKSDPNNGRVYYYLGICHMRLHEREKAEENFTWIDEHTKDPQLKLLAQTWLGRLDRHRKHISDNYSIAPPEVAKEHGPVKRVTWFYTNWCPKCRRFRAEFEKAQSVFKEVSFENLNAEAPQNWQLVSKFKVRSYPTLVYFDAKGRVIENYAAAPIGNTFQNHLKALGAKPVAGT